MKFCNLTKMRKLRILIYLKKVATFVFGVFFVLCFITGCYNICHQPFSGFVHSVILDDRYDNYTYKDQINERITFYSNGSHGYVKNNYTDKKVLRDVKWVITSDNKKDTLACYASKGFRGYLDVRTGHPVIPAERYTKAWLFSEGLAAVMEKDSTIKFIDTHGQVVIDKGFRYPDFSYGYLFYDSLCAMTDKFGKWGIIDRTGEWVIRPEYDGVAHINSGYWLLNKNEQRGLFDKKGQLVIPVEYREINVMEHGISVVLNDYTMQMMNHDGTLKYKFVCNDISDIYYTAPETGDDGEDIRKLTPCKAYYTNAGHYGLLSREGKPLTKPFYSSITGIGPDLYYCVFDFTDIGIILDGNGKQVNE